MNELLERIQLSLEVGPVGAIRRRHRIVRIVVLAIDAVAALTISYELSA